MTLTMCCKIIFHKTERRSEITMYKVSKIEFESSFKELTDKGSLVLPRNIKDFDKYNVRDMFRPGDALTISFGYDGHPIEEFTGYITRVSADIPITLEYENEMSKVKLLPVNYSAKNATLEDLLKAIAPTYEIDAQEGVQLGAVRYPRMQAGQVFEKLKSEWGVYTYMRGKKLTSGKYLSANTDKETFVFHLERNCVSTSLKYKLKEDVKIKIKCESTLRNGEKIEINNIGDEDGSERKLTFYGITDKEELERQGRMEYKKYKVDRFDGSFVAFGLPSVQHGQKVTVVSDLYKDRAGTYYIEKVVKTFDGGGIRQQITLGDKVST